jgi:hypothetical protein
MPISRRHLPLALVALVACRDSSTPPPESPVETSTAITVSGIDSMIGLLNLGGPVADGSGLLALPLQLRAAPSSTADTIVTVTRWVDLIAEEIDYEVPAVVVWRDANPWYLVSTHDSVRGWIELPDGGSVTLIPQLFENRLTYLTPAWDGRLFAAPDSSAEVTRAGGRDGDSEASVEVRESRMVDGTLWLRVALHDRSPCEGTTPPRYVADGWVKAWTGARNTVWYYSRGC